MTSDTKGMKITFLLALTLWAVCCLAANGDSLINNEYATNMPCVWDCPGDFGPVSNEVSAGELANGSLGIHAGAVYFTNDSANLFLGERAGGRDNNSFLDKNVSIYNNTNAFLGEAASISQGYTNYFGATAEQYTTRKNIFLEDGQVDSQAPNFYSEYLRASDKFWKKTR